MFIDVTRYGGMRMQRLAVAAIAYLDVVEGGCAIHLIGGETLRVNEDLAEIEARAMPTAIVLNSPIDREKELAAITAMETGGILTPAEATFQRAEAIVHRADVDAYPAKRQARGRNSR